MSLMGRLSKTVQCVLEYNWIYATTDIDTMMRQSLLNAFLTILVNFSSQYRVWIANTNYFSKRMIIDLCVSISQEPKPNFD